MPRLEVLFTPADFEALRQRDLPEAVCVVFDVLRATTSIVAALSEGAQAVVPVAEIPEAIALRRQSPNWVLAGEREGLRIGAGLTGGVEFDLGNSPREFTARTVRGKTLVLTTTNGTRALRACRDARTVLVGSFLNLQTTVDWLRAHPPSRLVLVGSGTRDEPALEDTLAAGALAELLWPLFVDGQVADGAVMARELYRTLRSDLAGAVRQSRNARRLLAHPELCDDVAFCLRRDTAPLLARLDADGAVRRWSGEP